MAAPRRVRQGDRRFLLRGVGTARRIDRENPKAGARQADRKDHRRPEAGLCIGDLAEGNGAGHSLSPFPSVRLRAPRRADPRAVALTGNRSGPCRDQYGSAFTAYPTAPPPRSSLAPIGMSPPGFPPPAGRARKKAAERNPAACCEAAKVPFPAHPPPPHAVARRGSPRSAFSNISCH